MSPQATLPPEWDDEIEPDTGAFGEPLVVHPLTDYDRVRR